MNEQDRPAYADYGAPAKFMAIESIIARRLTEHPKAVCSYSGGSDSDIMIDLIERTRRIFPRLPKVDYVFFNTGLEMQATKDHVKETAEKYGVEIREIRPKVGIVKAVRTYGVPFGSKYVSEVIELWQKKDVPLSIADEFAEAQDKEAKRKELSERFPKCETIIDFICCCDRNGVPFLSRQMTIASMGFLLEFMKQNKPDFQISAKCCNYCKKAPAHEVQKGYEMIITGERKAEGGVRAIGARSCFDEMSNGQYRLRPLYYVSDEDKAWYKQEYGIRYSDAYEVYGLTRTGCCGCPINYKAVEDLQKIEPFEPNVVKGAWAIFGKSYIYRKKYNEFKAAKKAEEKRKKDE